MPHLFKNITQSFLKHEKVSFDQCIIDHYNLTSKDADVNHIKRLHDIQKNDLLKMAPRLQSQNIRPTSFEKMKVSVSSNLIHPHVSTSLKYLGEQLQDNKFETTAWFAEILTK